MNNNTVPFRNPPITEALLDIRVNFHEINLERLALVQNEINAQYPIKKERHNWQGQLQFNPGNTPEIMSPINEVDGYLFISKDSKQVVQARKDGFTFNKLKPYLSWEDFSAQAKISWQHYIKMTRPVNVGRVALRYINRIEIPLPLENFGEYIHTIPVVAPGIPNSISGFFFQVVIPHPDIKATAIITETVEKTNDKGFLPFIFDIDVSINNIFQTDSQDIWEAFEKLRNFKNQIFLKSITEKTQELFK